MKSEIQKIKGKIKEFFSNFISVLFRPEMLMLPGSLAYFFVLAIIPTLGIISYSATVLNLSVDSFYNFISSSFSPQMADLILGLKLSNIETISFWITVLVGLYVASNGADKIITTSNTIYGIENKNWLKRRPKALFMIILLMVLIIFMLIVPVFGNTIIELIREINISDSLADKIINIFNIFKGPLTWVIIFIIIKVIYRVAPDKKKKSRIINYGAWFTTISWVIVTRIYSFYVNNYAEYSNIYGGLAQLVVLLIWVYLLSYIFVVGMALNYKKETNLEETAKIELSNKK